METLTGQRRQQSGAQAVARKGDFATPALSMLQPVDVSLLLLLSCVLEELRGNKRAHSLSGDFRNRVRLSQVGFEGVRYGLRFQDLGPQVLEKGFPLKSVPGGPKPEATSEGLMH